MMFDNYNLIFTSMTKHLDMLGFRNMAKHLDILGAQNMTKHLNLWGIRYPEYGENI